MADTKEAPVTGGNLQAGGRGLIAGIKLLFNNTWAHQRGTL